MLVQIKNNAYICLCFLFSLKPIIIMTEEDLKRLEESINSLRESVNEIDKIVSSLLMLKVIELTKGGQPDLNLFINESIIRCNPIFENIRKHFE